MPDRHVPHEQGDPGLPQANKQGHPPNREDDPGVPKVNEQGNPHHQDQPKVAQPDKVDNGLPAEMKIPQIDDDPMAVHVNGESWPRVRYMYLV